MTIDVTFTAGIGEETYAHQKILLVLVHGGAGASDGERVIGGTKTITVGDTVTLDDNDALEPAGTFYRATIPSLSPPVVRHFTLAADTPSSVSWADPTIQVVSPVPPEFTAGTVITAASEAAADAAAAAAAAVSADASADTAAAASTTAVTTAGTAVDTAGAALDAVTAFPEPAAGQGIILTEAPAGFVTFKRKFSKLATSAGAANTTTETSLLSAVVPLSTDDRGFESLFNICMTGIYTNNTGANRDITFRVKLDSTAVYTFLLSAIPTSATNRHWTIDATFSFTDLFGVRCYGGGRASMGAAGAGLDFGGITRLSDTTLTFGAPGAPLTTATSLNVTAQHSTNLSTLTVAGVAATVRRWASA